ncbi:MAG TPA: ATP-binding protein [Hansschlegelia sp.]
MTPSGAAKTALRTLDQAKSSIRARLAGRPDREHEIVLNRFVIAMLVLGYVSLAGSNPSVVQLASLFAGSAALFFVHMLLRPGTSVIRQRIGIVVDLEVLSYGMHLGDATTAILYPLYLWVIFGNGFRFGLSALRFGTAAGVIGFAVMIVTTPFWSDNLRLSLGLLSGLVVLPLYAGTLIKKLQDAKDVAEEASRAKSQFLASVSHELRTPLNAVIGMTGLLEETELGDEQRDMARTAGDAGRALLGLIDDLLNFSRLEAGLMPTNVGAFDLHDMLASARGMLATQAHAKGLRLGLHVTPRTPYRLRGDARKIRDVLVNLMSNAVKFTATGGVVASVDMISGPEERPRLRFEVSDTGIGVAPEARARIFESFTQADETIINSHGGTGLGLAICRQLIELQGGRIDVESEPGVGSVFWFELDLELDLDAAAEEPRAAATVALAATEERAEALVRSLASAGVAAEAAVDIRSALRLLRGEAYQGRCVVVIDGEETSLDGEALARAIRAADREERIEVVLVSPRMPLGLPDVELRLLCASAAAARNAEALAAMVRIASVGSAGRIAAQATPVAAQTSHRLAILVAEDNRTNQKVITKVLERAGHDVRIAENGEFALDALTERTFDIVLMDVNMPVLDGIECAKLYRFASIGKKRTPIVALTADATPTVRDRCLAAGMDACLTKPIEPAHLLATIYELTGVATGSALEEAERATAEQQAADDEIVSNIANHPNFRSARRTVVDRGALSELEELGGREFLRDLVDAFIDDAAASLRTLHEAAERGEAATFREQAHALRSGAANIGVRGMYELCLAYRNIDARDLATNGIDHVRQLEAEFNRACKILRHHFPEREESRGA